MSVNIVNPDGSLQSVAGLNNFPSVGTAAFKDSTNAVTAGSTDLVESGAVKSAIDNAVSNVYKPAGNKTVAELLPALLIADNLGNCYNMTTSGTTTSDFVGGAGNPINENDDVAVVDVGTSGSPSYKFNVLAGKIPEATTTNNGLMSSADKSKLNNVVDNFNYTNLLGTVDLNTVTDNGTYSVYISDAAAQHAPDTGYFTVTAIRFDNNEQFVFQIINHNATGTPTYMRRCSGGIWENWERFVKESDTDAITARNPRNISSDLSNLITAVSEQNLEKYGYKIGDYFDGTSQSSNNFRYWLADMDTFYGGYDYYAVESVHHIGIVVDTNTNSQWYTGSDITDVGYNDSTLHAYLSGTVLNIVKADMIALFGGSTGLEHLLGQTKLWNKLGTWYWSDENTHSQYIAALTEAQLTGTRIWSADNFQQGEGHKHLKIFDKYCYNQIFGWKHIWLRSISSSSGACGALNHGDVNYRGVTASIGAVGLILFH